MGCGKKRMWWILCAIAKANGIETVYFADQEMFSILGIWTSHKVIIYGE